jgi:probable rRNA maturation factor
MKKTTTDYHLVIQNVATSLVAIPSENHFQQWLYPVLTHQHVKKAMITIRLVDLAESAKLNQFYRHKSGPTNILSFHYSEMEEHEQSLVGDLVICPEIVAKEANEQKKTPMHHWAHLSIHGTLHLLGYDHIQEEDAKLMEGLEIKFLQDLGIPNPYEGEN